MVYRTAALYEAIIKWNWLDKYELVYSEEKIHIDVRLEKFGVDLEALKPHSIFSKQIFHCWVEY